MTSCWTVPVWLSAVALCGCARASRAGQPEGGAADGEPQPADAGVDRDEASGHQGDAAYAPDGPHWRALIPLPVSVTLTGAAFELSAGAHIYIEPATPEVVAVGQYLADKLRPSTGFALEVGPRPPASGNGDILLTTEGAPEGLGEEGYELAITPERVTLAAARPAGLFRGIQTLRQLLPAAVERASVGPGPWLMPAGTIRDFPRFAWRGMMLDVARHFFGVSDVERLIDLAASYKLNRFHLHLSDDQGWRLHIESWPRLGAYGGSTQVGGGPGGFFSQAEYSALVAYAQQRYIVIVPEFDTPGHTNAALASYAELSCDGVARPLYTGMEVGFSGLCTGKEVTYRFLDDVVREVAALTHGPYLHLGGDEASATAPADYVAFVNRLRGIVEGHGKQLVGWAEIGSATLSATSIAQSWSGNTAAQAVAQGSKAIMSPATHAYLDMKYEPATPFGATWAGYVNVEAAYTWDPATEISGIGEADVIGVESPLWSETLSSRRDAELLAFPRLLGHAEIGWSARAGRSWKEYRTRLAAHGPRLGALGVTFYASPEVEWVK